MDRAVAALEACQSSKVPGIGTLRLDILTNVGDEIELEEGKSFSTDAHWGGLFLGSPFFLPLLRDEMYSRGIFRARDYVCESLIVIFKFVWVFPSRLNPSLKPY